MVFRDFRELGQRRKRGLALAVDVRLFVSASAGAGGIERGAMPWYTFAVSPSVHGPIVAENLRAVAATPLARSVIPQDALVLRKPLDNGERYFFSPAAAMFFDPFVTTYGGTPCEAPFASDVPPGVLRLEIANGAAWMPVVGLVANHR
jgi:hypothetical protein